MPIITKPIIHLNGTSGEELRAGYVEAYRAVNAAFDAVKKCSPNGRDYYLVPGSLSQAIRENNDRLNHLTRIAEELMDLAQHCDENTK